jgi:hypothetical protein
VSRNCRDKAPPIDAPDAASGLPKNRLLPHIRVIERRRECAAAALQTMSERAASATTRNHPQTSQTQCGNRRNLIANAKNACSGGVVVYARSHKQNANLQLENGSSQMGNVHAFNARSIVAACAKQKNGKLRFSCQQSSKNATDRLCYDCDRKRCSRCNKEKGYKEFSHAVLDLDVRSPDLLRTERVAGPNKEGFGNALISVAASRNLVLSSALPSQSSDMECAVILNNAMLAYRDMKQK